MSNRESIEKEINELLNIKSSWEKTIKQKSTATDLVSFIQVFNHTFKVNYPNSAKHTTRSTFARRYIEDGMSELQIYSKSALIPKDDKYFDDGIKNITYGIQKLITYLQDDFIELVKNENHIK